MTPGAPAGTRRECSGRRCMAYRIWPAIAFLAVLAATAAQSQTDSSQAPPDTLASGGVLRGSTLRRLPIDDPRQGFTLIPGVVLRSGDIGIAGPPDFSIRGGVPGRASVYVDGAPVRFQMFGTQGIGLAANAIADVSLTTGVAPVHVADGAGGGVVSYVTRAGGDRLDGQVRWDSDEPFGDGVSVGYNRLEGSVGGPLPIAANLSFFLSATLQGQRSNYRGLGAASVPTYVPAGIDTVVESVSLVHGAAGPGQGAVCVRRQCRVEVLDHWARQRPTAAFLPGPNDHGPGVVRRPAGLVGDRDRELAPAARRVSRRPAGARRQPLDRP